jgi:protease-4
MGLLILVFIFLCFFIIFAVYAVKNLSSDGGEIEAPAAAKSSDDLIAVVEVKGIIMDARKVVEDLIKAEEKDKVKAIILRIESPGGAVGPSQEIYEEIRRIDQKKPVYASLGTVAASGGYYIAAATRKIYSSPGTLTGSIGVIMETMDMSELFHFAKLSPQILKAGKYKDVGGPHRKMTEEERAIMEGMLKNVHQQFISDILKTRKAKIKGNISDLAQGQVYSGESAQKVGLVDELAGLWSAGRMIHQELKLKGKFKLTYIEEKKKKFALMDFMNYMDETKTFLGEISNYISTQNQQGNLRISYR